MLVELGEDRLERLVLADAVGKDRLLHRREELVGRVELPDGLGELDVALAHDGDERLTEDGVGLEELVLDAGRVRARHVALWALGLDLGGRDSLGLDERLGSLRTRRRDGQRGAREG